jgi:hypothetical protein
LPYDIKQSETVDAFKDKLTTHLKFSRAYKPYLHSPNRHFIQIGRMRMGLSALNAHRRKYHFINNSSCDFCPNNPEDISHYLLQCPRYTAARTTMLNSLVTILPQNYQNLIHAHTKHKLSELAHVLTQGIQKSEHDLQIFQAVASFIEASGRFT